MHVYVQEYRYWLLTLVKLLAADGQQNRLRAILDGFLAPSHGTAGSGIGGPLPGGLDRSRLLEEALGQVATNLALQRLYSEYRCVYMSFADLELLEFLMSDTGTVTMRCTPSDLGSFLKKCSAFFFSSDSDL